MRCTPARTHDQSPDRESNPRPSPYHGDALPTELSGRRRRGYTAWTVARKSAVPASACRTPRGLAAGRFRTSGPLPAAELAPPVAAPPPSSHPPARPSRRVRTPRAPTPPSSHPPSRGRTCDVRPRAPTCELGGAVGPDVRTRRIGRPRLRPRRRRTPRWLVATESHLPSADPAEFAPPVARSHLRCATSETGVRTRQPEPDPGANSAARAGPRCELGDGGEVLGRRDVVAARPRRAPNDRGPVPRGGRGRSHGGG